MDSAMSGLQLFSFAPRDGSLFEACCEMKRRRGKIARLWRYCRNLARNSLVR
jgi:hypothetical protein